MPRIERTKAFQLRITEEELATMHRLAGETDETVGRMIRRLVREEAARRENSAIAVPK